MIKGKDDKAHRGRYNSVNSQEEIVNNFCLQLEQGKLVLPAPSYGLEGHFQSHIQLVLDTMEGSPANDAGLIILRVSVLSLAR